MQRKWLFVFDPKALQEIVVKYQDIYEETPIFLTGNRLILGEGLLATVGEHHRRQRKMFNPSFSTGQLRQMLPTFYGVVDKLRQALTSRIKDVPAEVDILDWMTRTALEIVGQGGLGYSFDPLIEDVPNACAEAMRALEPTLFPMYILRVFMPQIVKIGSPAFRRWILELTPYRRLQRLKNITDTLENTAKQILAEKKAALAEGDEALTRQVGEGKDIISVLLKANMSASDENRIPDSELLGHMTTLIFSAMSTTSHTLCRILHQLAIHQGVQKRLREEIISAKVDEAELSYDKLMSLPFLDAVCKETLRLYPSVSFIGRRTQKPVIMSLSTPIRGVNGNPIDKIPIPEQSTILIGIAASNTNKALWGADALEWKPDRWLSPLPQAVTEAGIPGIFANQMTFLGGGRSCIGYKFAEMEMKVVLTTLLGLFSFEIPTGKEICWNLAGIQYPTVGTVSTKAEMPLRIVPLRVCN